MQHKHTLKTKKNDNGEGQADCAELPGGLEGVKIKYELRFRSSTQPASRGRADCRRFAQSAGPGPEQAGLSELFFALLGVFGIILA